LTSTSLYAVAVNCGVDRRLAWLYVPCTDGLALVAYGATTMLSNAVSRAYAWSVVVLAAGLSATAQGSSHLHRLPGSTAEILRSDVRFGVGCWPAVSVAVCAHLLWLVLREQSRDETTDTETEVETATETGDGGVSETAGDPELVDAGADTTAAGPGSPGPDETAGRQPGDLLPGGRFDDPELMDSVLGSGRRGKVWHCQLPCCKGKQVSKATHFKHKRQERERLEKVGSNGKGTHPLEIG
jgi:hypothetical protein